MVEEVTVEISIYDCDNCGSTNGPSLHGDCAAPVLYTGGTWQCGSCGVRIRPKGSCAECGHETTPERLATPLDMRPAAIPRTIEQSVHKATNRCRRDHGIDILSYSDHLSAIALRHSRDMAARDYFDHDSPEGASAADRYRRFGHDDRSVGENIAFREVVPTAGAMSVAEGVVEGWMDSPGHRENILRERFEAEGIGAFCDPDGTVFVTQNFR